MQQSIRNIIFDLGGVIINIDTEKTRAAFAGLAKLPDGAMYMATDTPHMFQGFEKGSVSPGEFRDHMRAALGRDIDDHSIDKAWNAMLGDIPVERLERLLQLKDRYNTFLLSNTNVIHINAFNDILEAHHGYPDMAPFFNKVYYSHLVGLRKPSPEIFQLILDENGLLAEKTLFMDDTAQHLQGAKKVGILTAHVTPENDMLHILRDF